MDYKIRVGVIFGGKSAEHEVSIQSSINIIRAIIKDKYAKLKNDERTKDKVIVAVSMSASYLFRKVRRYPVIQFKYN